MSKRLYLTLHETEKIMQATQGAKNELRDHCMILTGFIHGLRVSELTGLRVADVDFLGDSIYIHRLKNGFSSVHPLQPEEKTLLMRWMRIRPVLNSIDEGWLFPGPKGKRISRQQVYAFLKKYGKKSGLIISVHPHMLRHSCGYQLAEQGLDTRLIQDYLGHRNIRHTVHYTAANVARFVHAWKPKTTKEGKNCLEV